MTDATPIDNETAVDMLKAVLAAHDSKCQLWDLESVEFARKRYQARLGYIPSIEMVVGLIGVDRAELMIPQIVEWRKFNHALVGKHDPCHFCGSKERLQRYRFGLMHVESSTRNWGAAAATATISAVTLPFLGVARIFLPGKSYSGALLRLQLVVCEVCAKKNRRLLTGFWATEKHAMRHPLWESLHAAGFTKYIDPEDLGKR